MNTRPRSTSGLSTLILCIGLSWAGIAHSGSSMAFEADLWSKSHADYRGWLTGVSLAFLDRRGDTVYAVDIAKLYVNRGFIAFSVGTDKEEWDRCVTQGSTLRLQSDQVTEEFGVLDTQHDPTTVELTSDTLKRSGSISWYVDTGDDEPLW